MYVSLTVTIVTDASDTDPKTEYFYSAERVEKGNICSASVYACMYVFCARRYMLDESSGANGVRYCIAMSKVRADCCLNVTKLMTGTTVAGSKILELLINENATITAKEVV